MAQKPTAKKSDGNNNPAKKDTYTNKKSSSSAAKHDVPVKDRSVNSIGGILDFFKNFDFKTVLNTFSDLSSNYKKIGDIIKRSLTDADEFFGQVKQENVNVSLGFFLIVIGVMIVFEFISNLFAGEIVGAVSVIVFMLVFWPVFCLIGVIIAYFILKLTGSKGTFSDTVKIACYTSWLGIIMSFPLTSILGTTLNTLISFACMAMGAFIWIKGSVIVLKMNKDRVVMVIGAITGILILLGLIGLFVS